MSTSTYLGLISLLNELFDWNMLYEMEHNNVHRDWPHMCNEIYEIPSENFIWGNKRNPNWCSWQPFILDFHSKITHKDFGYHIMQVSEIIKNKLNWNDQIKAMIAK